MKIEIWIIISQIACVRSKEKQKKTKNFCSYES